MSKKIKHIINKKYLIGGDVAKIGTVNWTDEVIQEADRYFNLLEKEAKERGISVPPLDGIDYVEHIFESLVALNEKNATPELAEKYYRDWLLSKEEELGRAAKKGGRYYLRGGSMKKYQRGELINSFFKDIHGITPKVGDFIIDEDKKIGKILSFFKTDFKHVTNDYRMVVDFMAHITELNTVSKFEIIEHPDEKIRNFFKNIGTYERGNKTNKRYAVTIDFYMYAEDDEDVITKSQEFVRDQRDMFDNRAQILDITEVPFGSLKTRKLENVPKI